MATVIKCDFCGAHLYHIGLNTECPKGASRKCILKFEIEGIRSSDHEHDVCLVCLGKVIDISSPRIDAIIFEREIRDYLRAKARLEDV